ncbi:MtrAB system histidine kinase MtrB [Agromyces sp. H3Y2-19a]|jgi:two-component system sensor histidine kinase MtrB|uniref:MtrAB system histidine kinase MtrB n=1 Tax=Agromyces TaxID=33877 RepID=UPI001E3C8835|nr:MULTISPECIES: MtrAB system histidine kinase MtrB [Agromyces]MCD5347736.1 HAMP domain-containing histidine kinase [Agromyces sp. S2-1-8]MDF0514684.1 MtrAB system histidine kinase MtrB [Agromyces chromiiresistens]
MTEAHAAAMPFAGSWREQPRRLAALWRRSLQFRTVAITLALSSLAIFVIGLYISFSVASNLFQNQLDESLGASNNATTAAQSILNSSDASDRASLQALMNSTARTVQSVSGSTAIAYFRIDEEPNRVAPPDRGAPALDGVITEELQQRVADNPEGQFWQSVALEDGAGGTDPGVVVASSITVPQAGRYGLYIGYNFADAQETLAFMQTVGIIGAIALLALLSAITLLVVRWVIEPIRSAAATSRRLAAGDLGVRMPSKGEDELATLAASFNGMADSLQARIRELAELSVMQQRFVSDVSHELRTPLTTIRLAGDVLYGQRDDFAGPTSRTVELLHTQTDRFETLLADLLEISRYDAGSVELTTQPTNLVHLAGDAIESMHELAREHGSELRLVAPGGHLDADVDPRRIRRIVRNLLGNAIEHGEGKPIVVAVDSNESAVALSVRDYGLGMTEVESARVFDRFWRADPSRTRTIGGTGLGLAISLEDAVAHGGVLDVWSKPGAGSVFRLTLPRTRDAEAVVSPLPLEPDDVDATGPPPTGVVTAIDLDASDGGRHDA